MAEKEFLGTGWSFPPTFSKKEGGVAMVSGEDDIQQSLHILLSTTLGERILHSRFGCNLMDYVHESLNTTIKTRIKNLVEKAIILYEPRIDLIKLRLDTTEELEGQVTLDVQYKIRSTNSRSNYVYPFYLTEGTNT